MGFKFEAQTRQHCTRRYIQEDSGLPLFYEPLTLFITLLSSQSKAKPPLLPDDVERFRNSLDAVFPTATKAVTSANRANRIAQSPTLVKPFVMTKIDLTESKSALSHQIKSIISALNWGVQPSPLTLKMGREMGLIDTFGLGEWFKASPNKEHLAKFALYDGGPIKDGQPVWNLATMPYNYLTKGQEFGQTKEYLKVIFDGSAASVFFLPYLVTHSGLTAPGAPVKSFQLNAQPLLSLFMHTISNICFGGCLGNFIVVNSYRQGINFSTLTQVSTYDGWDTMFVLGHHTLLPVLDWDLRAGDFVVVTFTVSWYKWRKPEQDKASGKDGLALASPQKKAVEGYRMAVSLNIQDVILMEASEEHIVEMVPVTEPVDEPELM
ncbi:hypothetical protein M422DRAFT_241390 [Sphaerobolus stellatus SS14]|nr:hypothetical protein M422DRAFT_241390 [Sphaerobolus stellatus SS14]